MAVKSAVARAEIEDADKGEVTLVFARYNEVDKDGDVTTPGAFDDGAKAPFSAYGHGSTLDGRLPVGVATIRIRGNEAQAKGRFFMDTADGADTFRVVKRLHEAGLGEWSYGYETKQFDYGQWDDGRRVRFLRKQFVTEISPVLRGAGMNTATLSAKSAKGNDDEGTSMTTYAGLIRPHETATEDGPWVPSDLKTNAEWTVADLRGMHAFVDATADPELKSSYRFMHHAEPGGPANIKACYVGLGRLAVDVSIADDAKVGVYNHLAGHLADAGRWTPELDSTDVPLKFGMRTLTVLADLAELRSSAAEIGVSRLMKGRSPFTGANTDLLAMLQDEVRALHSLVDSPSEEMHRVYMEHVRRQMSLRSTGE